MSTALKLQPSSPAPVAMHCRIQTLLAAAAIRADDRVAVIGHGSFDLLLGLSRSGCAGAVAVRSPALCRGEAGNANAVWFTGLESIGPEVSAAIDHLDSPRMVAIELTRDSAKAGLACVLGQLRAKGLADQSIRKAGERTLVVASRPAWLRQIL